MLENIFNLLNSKQFGILAGQNTYDALIDFLDKAYDAFNQIRVLLTFFLDFSEAFDTVDHEILPKKKCIAMTSEVEVWTGCALF